jgi:sugar (pentulose or hexulose) kinase
MTARALGCALGIDLGTSALKVVALSEKGRILGTAREPYPTVATCEGQAEQDCSDWLTALSRAVKKIHEQRTRKLHVQAIGLTGQMPSLVVLNRGKILGSAISWQDSRADNWASERLNSGLRDDIYRRTGVVIDGRYLAPMYGFHRKVKSRDDVILSAKDFLTYALTGVAATDPSTASGYALYSLQSSAWDHQMCDFWNISADQLPSIKRSLSSLPLSSQGSKLVRCASGTPVIVGCADSAAGLYALSGSAANHDFTILTGSSTVIIKSDSSPHWDPELRYVVTPLAGDERYGREADLLASGSARDWLQKLFAGNDAKARRLLWEGARTIAPGANGVFFAPYLAGGEQGVLWNPELKGILTGLTCAHGPAHIARALLEGMSFEIRRCVEVLGGEPRAPVRMTGWMAENPADSQILADILDRPVHAYKLPSASAVGAALLTGFADQKTYFSEMTPSAFSSNTKNTRCYDELFASYIEQFPTSSCCRREPPN